MASPDPIDNPPEDRRQTVSDPTPLYAILGIADAAAARIRITRADLKTRTGGLDPKAISDLTRTKISAGVDAVQTDVKAAPGSGPGSAQPGAGPGRRGRERRHLDLYRTRRPGNH